MFRKKSTTLFPPVPLNFQEILSDLKALQTYNHSTDNEENKVDVLEILNDDEAEESHESPETSNSNIPWSQQCLSLFLFIIVSQLTLPPPFFFRRGIRSCFSVDIND